MLQFREVEYRKDYGPLLNFATRLDLWVDPRAAKPNGEIAFVLGTWTGVLNTPRPMVTLYSAEKMAHSPMSGTIVLIDDTPDDLPPSHFHLRLEGRPYHDFNLTTVWAPIFQKEYHLNPENWTGVRNEIREDILQHFANTPYSSRERL